MVGKITTLPNVGFGFKNGFWKMEESVGRSTRRVLPWHGKGSEYLQGTAEEIGDGHDRLTWFMK
jgi:hypothetical protein